MACALVLLFFVRGVHETTVRCLPLPWQDLQCVALCTVAPFSTASFCPGSPNEYGALPPVVASFLDLTRSGAAHYSWFSAPCKRELPLPGCVLGVLSLGVGGVGSYGVLL